MKFFTSDLHINHNKDFIYAARGYKDIESMNWGIVDKINEIVTPFDDLYILGDLCLGGEELMFDNRIWLNQLHGHLHIILGNHDTNNRIKMYESLGNVDSVSFGERIKLGKVSFMLSHYPQMTANFDDGKKYWQRTYNLCGHTHTTDPDEYCHFGCLNVGIDAWDGYPVSEEVILNHIKNWSKGM